MISSLHCHTAELNADCVEAVPAHVCGMPGITSIAMYQLDEATRERLGRVKIWSVDDVDSDAARVTELHNSTLPGVLDLKWYAGMNACDVMLSDCWCAGSPAAVWPSATTELLQLPEQLRRNAQGSQGR
jgi:hypothetical protein